MPPINKPAENEGTGQTPSPSSTEKTKAKADKAAASKAAAAAKKAASAPPAQGEQEVDKVQAAIKAAALAAESKATEDKATAARVEKEASDKAVAATAEAAAKLKDRGEKVATDMVDFLSPRVFRLHEGVDAKGVTFEIVKGKNSLPASFFKPKPHWYLVANECTDLDGNPLVKK